MNSGSRTGSGATPLPLCLSLNTLHMRHRFRLLVAALTGAALLGNTACYAFLEPPRLVTGIPLGADVRITLTDSGAVVLRSLLGPSVEFVDGSFRADTARAYVVQATSVSYRSGNEERWRGETVTIDKSLVSSVGVRQFSPGRTAILAAGVLAVLLGIRQVFVGVGQGSTTITGHPRTGGQ